MLTPWLLAGAFDLVGATLNVPPLELVPNHNDASLSDEEHDSDLLRYRPVELDACLSVHPAFVQVFAIVELQLSLAQTRRFHNSSDNDARGCSMP